MINEKDIEILVERLVNRIEKANEYFLEGIGEYIKKVGNISPSKAYQLIQILKYGEDYNEIVNKISKLTNLNIADINNIFSNYAKKDQMFYEKFYKYRNILFLPYEENIALKTQTVALANIVANEMYNYTRNNVLGYTINGKFYNLRETYNKVLDEALLNVGLGRETFDSAMTNIMKEIGGSGLKTLVYDSTYIDKYGILRHRTKRLDSSIRMHLQGRLRELHYENQRIIAEEIQADGWEISAHFNPAPDHADVQGRQFSIEEYNKLQDGLVAKDYKGKHYTLDKNDRGSYRPIREMNCKHTEFSIVLGASKPEYTDEQLQQIIDDNNKGFELDGKHYTNYEGTQIQRNLERRIREQKDIQILAKASGETGKELVLESQDKITKLTRKYKELSNISGLPTKMERMKVSGYKRVAKNKLL